MSASGRWDRWERYFTAFLALALVTWAVSPSRSSTRLLESMAQSMSGMIRATTGIRDRDPNAVADYQALPADIQTSIWEMLSPADRMWVESVMHGT